MIYEHIKGLEFTDFERDNSWVCDWQDAWTCRELIELISRNRYEVHRKGQPPNKCSMFSPTPRRRDHL